LNSRNDTKLKAAAFVIELERICYVKIWERNMPDDDDDAVIRIQTLPDAQLIQILQHHDFDDDITRMVEAEIARRKQQGRQQ
jgi:hypothetical protein